MDLEKQHPSTYNKTISADEIKLFIGRIFQYGYTGTVDIDWRSQNAADADKMAHIMATQTLIWETVVGERDTNFNHVDTGSYDAVNDRVSKNHPLYSQYISYYNSIASNVQKHSKVPSFFAKSTSTAQDIELEWNGTNYTATLTDNNNVLGNYTFTASESGISFSVSGNKLTITATKAPTSKVSITATKNQVDTISKLQEQLVNGVLDSSGQTTAADLIEMIENHELTLQNQDAVLTELKEFVESQKNEGDADDSNEVTFFAYTVVSGDSLSKICNEHNLDYNANIKIILAINGISNANQIYVGQTILLPLTD